MNFKRKMILKRINDGLQNCLKKKKKLITTPNINVMGWMPNNFD